MKARKINRLLTLVLLLAIIFGLAEAGESPNPKEWLDPHNQARRAVGESPLTWDNRLAQYAQWYGNQRKNDCAMVHSTGPYGENLYWGEGTWWTPRQVVNSWISEKGAYNRRTNTCRIKDCGHYTQIVWKDTRRVGCARVVCSRGAGVIFVCEYDPPGNYYGEYPY